MATPSRSAGSRIARGIVGAIFGVLFGLGAGLFLSQTGTLNMASKAALIVPLAFLVVGFLIGAMGGRKPKV